MPPADRSRGVGAQQPLTTDEVEALIARFSSRFDWDGDWHDPVIERLWSTRFTGNRFAMIAPREGAERVVIKMLGPRDKGEAGRESSQASLLASRMEDLADLLADQCPADASAPRPLGWLDEPPVVAAPFVEGTELKRAIGQRDHALSVTSRWVSAAGSALAAFHERGPTSSSSETPAIAELEATLGRYRLADTDTATLLDYATSPGVLVPRFQDFSTTNTLGQEDGRIVVLDPPIELETAPRHRDIARFLFHIRRNLAGMDAGTVRADDPQRGDTMRGGFLASYEAQCDFDVRVGRGRALLAVYESVEALSMARRRARRRGYASPFWLHWRSVAWGTMVGLSGRVQVIRALREER